MRDENDVIINEGDGIWIESKDLHESVDSRFFKNIAPDISRKSAL